MINCLFLTLLCLACGQDAYDANLTCDDTGLLQPARSDIQQSRKRSFARDWKTSRDLATVADIQPIPIRGLSVKLTFSSAVPVFGPDESYIALMAPFDRKQPVEYVYNQGAPSLFCSGRGSSHRTAVRVIGNETNTAWNRFLVFVCDWPRAESHLERFEVFLEDDQGKHLGTVVAEQKNGMLKQYRTVACVRDVYPNKLSGLRLLPQWLEFHLQHGVDHIMFYTLNLDSKTLQHIWEPYIRSGQATRVHFDKDFASNSGAHNRATLINPMMQDCLYRFKNHATWLIPGDLDEWFNMKDGSIFPGRQVPQDYLGSTWDAVVKSKGLEVNQVHSITFHFYRFAIAQPGEVELSSVVREPDLQPRFPKYVVNTKAVNVLWIHYVTSWADGTRGLCLSPDMGVGHHYREPFSYPTSKRTWEANTKDDSMLKYMPALSTALAKRFHERNMTNFLSHLEKQKDLGSLNLYKEKEHSLELSDSEPSIPGWVKSCSRHRSGIQVVQPPLTKSAR